MTNINLGDHHEGDPHVLRVFHFLTARVIASAAQEATTWLAEEDISSDYHHFFANYDDNYGTCQPSNQWEVNVDYKYLGW